MKDLRVVNVLIGDQTREEANILAKYLIGCKIPHAQFMGVCITDEPNGFDIQFVTDWENVATVFYGIDEAMGKYRDAAPRRFAWGLASRGLKDPSWGDLI